MLTASRTVRRLRTPKSGNNTTYRYCVAPIGCSSQGSLYTIEVTSPINYGEDDPKIQIYVFSNPKAAQYFVKENIDTGFKWPEMEKRLKYAPDYNELMPEAHVICAGKAKFDKDTWIYPAPLGIDSASTGAEHGHAYVTETAIDSFTGPMAQGYLTIVVVFPEGSTTFSDYEANPSDDTYMLEEVRQCSRCGYFGTDVGADSCPKCGTLYHCTHEDGCDYVGTSSVCSRHKDENGNTVPVVCEPVSFNNAVLYSISAPITITVQFFQE